MSDPVTTGTATIRAASVEDADVLRRLNAEVQAMHSAAWPSLFKASVPDAFSPAALRNMLADKDILIFIAEDGAAPAGYIYAQIVHRPEDPFRYAQDVVAIHQMAVTADRQRRGHGERLLRHVLSLARTRGVSRAELGVMTFNREARAFYERRGFVAFSERMALDIADLA